MAHFLCKINYLYTNAELLFDYSLIVKFYLSASAATTASLRLPVILLLQASHMPYVYLLLKSYFGQICLKTKEI